MIRRRNMPNVISDYEVKSRFNLTLNPCPFCGNPHVGIFAGPFPHVTCPKCDADGPLAPKGQGQDERQYRAGVLWNERATLKEGQDAG